MTVLVLFGLGALAVVIDLFVGVLLGGVAMSALDTLGSSGYASSDYDVTVRGLQAALVVAGLADVAILGFLGWAARAVYRRVALVRPLIVLKAVAEAVVTIAFHGLSGSGAGPTTLVVIVGLAFDAALLVLLWVPQVSRQWFGDASGAATVADLWPPRSATPVPAPRPAPQGPPAPPAARPAYGPRPGHRVPDQRHAPHEDPVTVRLVVPRHAARPDTEPAS